MYDIQHCFICRRFLCVGGCWDRTQDSCDYGIGRRSNHSAIYLITTTILFITGVNYICTSIIVCFYCAEILYILYVLWAGRKPANKGQFTAPHCCSKKLYPSKAYIYINLSTERVRKFLAHIYNLVSRYLNVFLSTRRKKALIMDEIFRWKCEIEKKIRAKKYSELLKLLHRKFKFR